MRPVINPPWKESPAPFALLIFASFLTLKCMFLSASLQTSLTPSDPHVTTKYLSLFWHLYFWLSFLATSKIHSALYKNWSSGDSSCNLEICKSNTEAKRLNRSSNWSSFGLRIDINGRIFSNSNFLLFSAETGSQIVHLTLMAIFKVSRMISGLILASTTTIWDSSISTLLFWICSSGRLGNQSISLTPISSPPCKFITAQKTAVGCWSL